MIKCSDTVKTSLIEYTLAKKIFFRMKLNQCSLSKTVVRGLRNIKKIYFLNNMNKGYFLRLYYIMSITLQYFLLAIRFSIVYSFMESH